ncbi:MAG: hypothetical protein IH944_05910 [Armatimonadetes bacterium]|nr:hypothetical protein [Armatimonadota bacterium]
MMKMSHSHVRGALLASLILAAAFAFAQTEPAPRPTTTGKFSIAPELLTALKWRSIGPSVMVGRITDIEGVPSDPSTFYVATATGGLWKTTNAGTTFEALFQNEGSISLGDVAVSKSDPNIVWVGTGEHHARNSVSWGDGVYKSTDGGKTWKNMGLQESFQIGRIAIHPTNPDIVYVGALGRLWGSNDQRGLFKTTDGGETWEKIHYINRQTGVIDVQMSPDDPDTLIFATYQRARDYYDNIPNYDPSVKWSETSAIYKTTDGGKSFKKLTNGLPTVRMGRVGLDYMGSNGDTIFAIIETELVGANEEQIDEWLEKEDRISQTYEGRREFSGSYQGQAQNIQDEQGPKGFETGGVFKSTDGGESWTRINSITQRPFYYSQIRVDPNDDSVLFAPGLQLMRSTDGGETFENSGRNTHSDHHAFWFDPHNAEHLLLGSDGGVYQSWDQGVNWNYHSNIVASQIYHLAVDTREPYHVFAGFQDNGSWGGPSRKRNGQGNRNADWYRVGGGDGFICLVDPNDPNTVYTEIQDGRMSRINLRTGERFSIRPPREEGENLRFLWDTPMALSAHNGRVFYCMGQYVYRSMDRGADLRQISPDLTRTERGSGSAFAESPRDPQVLWAGTDDGYLWVTRNGGTNWTNVTDNIDLRRESYVSRIAPSRFADGRTYVVFDGHRSNLDEPMLFVTEDFGETWTSLNDGLPEGSTRSIAEDTENEDLIFVGTEFGAFASFDRGQSWLDLRDNGLPTVAVHELVVHPTAGELVAGTHGRGIWIIDIAALRQVTAETLNGEPVLFAPNPATQWNAGPPRVGANYGAQNLSTDPAPTGATISCWLPAGLEEVGIEIRTLDGKHVANIETEPVEGLNLVLWNLRTDPPEEDEDENQRRRRRFRRQGETVAPGTYIVVMTVGGQEFTQRIEVRADTAS